MLKNQALAHYRDKRGYTLKSLAQKTGLRIETINRLEKGIETNPKLRTLELLTTALEVKLTDLIDESKVTK